MIQERRDFVCDGCERRQERDLPVGWIHLKASGVNELTLRTYTNKDRDPIQQYGGDHIEDDRLDFCSPECAAKYFEGFLSKANLPTWATKERERRDADTQSAV